jgi:biopolymer transport protein ExbD
MAIGGGSDRLMSDINVTPFVDVMLVLLIIFMVTAPMMVQGVDVALPEVSAHTHGGRKGKPHRDHRSGDPDLYQ